MQSKKEAIDKKVSDTIEIFSFKRMSEKFPEFCKCYGEKKQCHQCSDMNCFFCFCPEYENSEEGGCKIKSKDGKWFYNDKLPKGRIWDCSSCSYPHQKENAEKMLKKFMSFTN